MLTLIDSISREKRPPAPWGEQVRAGLRPWVVKRWAFPGVVWSPRNNGVVTLTGLVPSYAEKLAAARTAKRIEAWAACHANWTCRPGKIGLILAKHCEKNSHARLPVRARREESRPKCVPCC